MSFESLRLRLLDAQAAADEITLELAAVNRRKLAKMQADSSTSLLTKLPSLRRGLPGRSPAAEREEKPLPHRPISNLKDYMPASASRSSWSGMPFAQFERRVRHTTSPGEGNDIAELEQFLLGLMEEINYRRQALELKPWVVPNNDMSLMRHVCKVFYGEELEIPGLKAVGGKYEIDYEAMARDREVEEMLMQRPLIEMSTAEEEAVKEAVRAEEAEEAAWWDTASSAGIATAQAERVQRKAKANRKPSAFVEIWVNLGGIFRISVWRRHRQRQRQHPRRSRSSQPKRARHEAPVSKFTR